jgi:hypothetical protein
MYLAGGAGISYILFKILPIYGALPLILVVGGLSFALTFVKINTKPFIFTLEAWFRYVLDSRMFIWRKEDRKTAAKTEQPMATEQKQIETLTNDRLQKIAWGLNIIKED